MYPVVEIHSRDSGRAIFAGRNQGPCMARQRGRPPTLRSHAAATVVSAVWVAICGKRAIMPHCRRLCSPTLVGGRRGRPGERGRVNVSQLIIGPLLFAATVHHLLVTTKGNDAYRLQGMPYRSSYCHCYNAAPPRLCSNFE